MVPAQIEAFHCSTDLLDAEHRPLGIQATIAVTPLP
jgi:hypothetical protein